MHCLDSAPLTHVQGYAQFLRIVSKHNVRGMLILFAEGSQVSLCSPAHITRSEDWKEVLIKYSGTLVCIGKWPHTDARCSLMNKTFS